MKKVKMIISLIAAVSLTVSVMAVNVFAIGSGPASGNYIITNNADNMDLTVYSGNAVLDYTNGYAWKLTESPARNPYYYTITTLDGRDALAYDLKDNRFYLADPKDGDQDQRWMVTRVSGGYEIKSMNNSAAGEPGNGNVLYAETNTSGQYYYVNVGQRANYAPTDVWTLKATRYTATPTPTPTPAVSKAPQPTSNPANGSYINSGSQITLLAPNVRGASVVYSLIDPGRVGNVTWYPSTMPINTPNSGLLEFWAKTVSNYFADSDITHFVFQIQRVTPTPTLTPTPIPRTPTPVQRPPVQLTQVVLKVTMNQLQYTVNGIPAMFDVAPYLDSKANRSMIPMRFIAEAFGAAVSWDDATKTQTIMLNGKTFKLTENVPLSDGMGTPVLVKDRFFVPLRYVSQELGASVDWDDATQTNTIIYYK